MQYITYLHTWSDLEVLNTKSWLQSHTVTVGEHTCTVAQKHRVLPSFYSVIMENIHPH